MSAPRLECGPLARFVLRPIVDARDALDRVAQYGLDDVRFSHCQLVHLGRDRASKVVESPVGHATQFVQCRLVAGPAADLLRAAEDELATPRYAI